MFIAAVVKNFTTNEETNVKISSQLFYKMFRQNFREKKGKWYTHVYDEFAANDLHDNLKYEFTPSPKSIRYADYVEHRLTIFNRGIDAYTTRKYSRLHLDKHIRSQQAMDCIVNELTKDTQGNRILLAIGATEFSPNSPIKKYRRCPGVRQLVRYSNRIQTMDVVFVDEYNTSKSCGHCHRRYDATPFDEYRHKRWLKKRVCSDCQPHNDVIVLPDIITTRTASRLKQPNAPKTVTFGKTWTGNFLKTVWNKDL